MLTLGLTPRWASQRPNEKCFYGTGCAAPPKNLEYWIEYVDAVSRRYKGKIQYYEIWNEVSLTDVGEGLQPGDQAMTFLGTSRELALLAQAAYRTIKQNDPDAKVLSPSFHVYGDWIKKLDAFLSAGGDAAIDIISFHFYPVQPLPIPIPESTVYVIGQVKEVARKHRFAGPIWNTESGYNMIHPGWVLPAERQLSDFPTESRVANYVIRSAALWAGENIERFFWYSWDAGPMGLAYGTGRQLSEAVTAYQTAFSWIVGAHMDPCVSTGNPAVWTCRLERNGNNAWIAWTMPGPLMWMPPEDIVADEITDRNGTTKARQMGAAVEIGESPVLLTSAGSTWTPQQTKR
jgi:hypothetical protein